MDYGDILKRAWRVTWRYKALRVLGFFAGSMDEPCLGEPR